MKNRDKFRDEILKLSRDGDESNTCIFKKKNVLPQLYKDLEEGSCSYVRCAWCNVLLDFWLDEEYIEPPKPETDWTKVPIDTLVKVRDDEDQEWILQYFRCISDITSRKYVTWADGTTSKTSYGAIKRWKFCELVEDEDDGCN